MTEETKDGYADVGVVQIPKVWDGDQKDIGLWKVHVRYTDGEVYVSSDSFATHDEAMKAAEQFVLENLWGTQH